MQAEADASAGLGRFDRRATERQLQARLEEWRDLLGPEVAWTQQIIAKLIPGKIVVTPPTTKSGEAAIDVQIPWTVWPLFAGIHCPRALASPNGSDAILRHDSRIIIPAA